MVLTFLRKKDQNKMNKSSFRNKKNMRYPSFNHSVFTAGDEDQFNSSRNKTNIQQRENPDMEENVFKEENIFFAPVWGKFKDLDSRSVVNTFHYIFYKFVKGIFISIRDNKIVTFLPFSNAHYRNEFSDRIRVSSNFTSVQEFLNYISAKKGYKPQYHKPLNEWYSNNGLFRYETQKFLSDNNVETLLNMFETLCEKRVLPDIDFFVNRRDFPLIKRDNTEPYYNVYDSKTFKLLSHEYDKYSPLLSCSSNESYADIMMPTFEDWARSQYQENGKTFPKGHRRYPKIQTGKWEEKEQKIVFRGTTTGVGATPTTNQRLKAFEIAQQHIGLDVGFTSWNLRARKVMGSPFLQTIERKDYPLVKPLSLQEQSKFKFLLNLEGHVAAFRLSYELSSGSVILLADSDWKLWFSKFLIPWVHFVPVKNDLSDLIEKFEWCQKNDEKCKKIAESALHFYNKYLGENGILDFLQKLLWDICDTSGVFNYLPDIRNVLISDEDEQLNRIERPNFSTSFNILPGRRCFGRLNGFLQVFQTKNIEDLKHITLLKETKNCKLSLFQTNNFLLVGKFPENQEKRNENIHEAFIGLNATNTLLNKIPNFAFMFGFPKNDKNRIFVEYIPGDTLFSWLKSASYKRNLFINILIQLNLSIQVAQNHVGFIHFDLTPWNIVLHVLKDPVTFDYCVGVNNIISVETTVVPMIIDFGKSRALVHESEFGIVDHGIVNLFTPNSSVDTLTLIYSCAKSMSDQGMISAFVQFAKSVGVENAWDIKRYSKFGAWFNFNKNFKPLDFVDYLVIKFKPFNIYKHVNPFSYRMEKGNAFLTSQYMITGDINYAFLKLIDRMDKSSPPLNKNSFFQAVSNSMLQRQIAAIEDAIDIGRSIHIQRWKNVLKIFRQPPPKSQFPNMNYPTPSPILLDEFITPTQLEQITPKIFKENWLNIWTICFEAVIFKINHSDNSELLNFLSIDPFTWKNAIASHNTAHKLKKMLD